MKTKQPTDYCPQCGAYHKISVCRCESEQTEPDIEATEQNNRNQSDIAYWNDIRFGL